MVKRCRINLPSTLKAAIQAEPWVEMAADMCLPFLPAYWDCSPTPPFIRFKVIVALFLPLDFTHVGTVANPFRAIAEGQRPCLSPQTLLPHLAILFGDLRTFKFRISYLFKYEMGGESQQRHLC